MTLDVKDAQPAFNGGDLAIYVVNGEAIGNVPAGTRDSPAGSFSPVGNATFQAETESSEELGTIVPANLLQGRPPG